MKQFLRYQISGTTFFLWFIIFNFSDKFERTDNFLELCKEIKTIEVLSLIVFALPLGVFIHQISVIVKNCIVCKCKWFSYFDDSPNSLSQANGTFSDGQKYALEKISNLNTFYYLRVDNGLLAPLLALIISSLIYGPSFNLVLLIIYLFYFILMLSYIPRIHEEIKYYSKRLNPVIRIPQVNKKNIYLITVSIRD